MKEKLKEIKTKENLVLIIDVALSLALIVGLIVLAKQPPDNFLVKILTRLNF